MHANIVLGAYLLSGTPGYRQAGVHQYAKRLLEEFARMLPSPAGSRGRNEVAWGEGEFTVLISPTARAEAPQPTPIPSPFVLRHASRPDTQHTQDGSGQALKFKTASRTTERPFSRIYVEQIETPRVLRELRADLYHGLGFVVPLRPPCPTVVSVMDLSFLTQPHTHKLFNRIYLSLFTRWSCRRAARVIAISEWTKRDVVKHFGVSPDCVDAIPLGVDHQRFKPSPLNEIAQFKQANGIGDSAIFFLGSLEPRKNLPTLIEALALMTQDDRRQSTDDSRQSSIVNRQLIIGGSPGWKYDEIFQRVQSLGLADKVKLIGRVNDEDLPKWYSACAVFAYPSLYEGFGLPVLEAMACGVVVVTSNATSLPEIVDDAGIMVEPTDAKALADALQRVLDDENLRESLRAKARARAAKFTWQRTADQTLKTYQRVLTLM